MARIHYQVLKSMAGGALSMPSMSARAYQIILAGVVISGIWAYHAAPLSFSGWYVWACVGVTCVVIAVQARDAWPGVSCGSYMRVDVVFAFFFFLVFHWPYVVALVLPEHYAELRSPHVSRWLEYSNKAVCLATVALVSYVWGYGSGHNMRPSWISGRVHGKPTWSEWSDVGMYILSAGCILQVVYITLVGRSLFVGRYVGTATGDITQDGIYATAWLLARTGYAVVMLAECGMPQRQHRRTIANAMIYSLMAFVLVIGDRSCFVEYVVLVLFVRQACGRGIGPKRLVTLGVLGMILLVAAGNARTAGHRSPLSFARGLGESASEARVLRGSLSFASSASVLRAALDHIPREHEYYYGAYKLRSVVGCFPFYRGIIFPNAERVSTSTSQLMAYIMNGHFNWGVGTNVVADLYIDFGWPGVVGLMFMLGRLCRWLQRTAVQHCGSIPWAVANILLAVAVGTIARRAYSGWIRTVFWPLLLLLFIEWILLKRRGIVARRCTGAAAHRVEL